MFGNPYYNNPQPRYQPMYNSLNNQTQQQLNQQFMQPIQSVNPALLGKMVDSVEVVKATDILLDGSISYFPLVDGSAIVTKQLQSDGTTKMIIYKPIDEKEKEVIKYATIDDVEKAVSDIDLSDVVDLKEDIKELKKEIEKLKNKLKGKED